ncbi:MAG TPA: hypothetical protein VEZ20_05395 [Allosphingosinicella sp.]|nr:hypothetical protein [Allosphingosinicella sp.]
MRRVSAYAARAGAALANPAGRRRAARRFAQLFLGLVAYGVAIAILVRAGLGLNPWDVFHQGVAARTGLSFGTVLALTGGAVLLLWIPLRQRPGIGTVANILVIGVCADLALSVMPAADGLAARWAMLGGGILLLGTAGAAYLGSGLGPGPRDGLMTGLNAATGWPIRRARTVIEVVVLAIGWLLGGSVGVGTIVFALAIGPVVQFFLPFFAVEARSPLPPPDCAGR